MNIQCNNVRTNQVWERKSLTEHTQQQVSKIMSFPKNRFEVTTVRNLWEIRNALCFVWRLDTKAQLTRPFLTQSITYNNNRFISVTELYYYDPRFCGPWNLTLCYGIMITAMYDLFCDYHKHLFLAILLSFTMLNTYRCYGIYY